MGKTIEFVTLVVLTFAALVYNIHFYYGIPNEMYVQTFKWAAAFPANYTDVTNRPFFRTNVWEYLEISLNLGEPIRIPKHSTTEYWLQSAFESSPWAHAIHLRYESDYYMVQIWHERASSPDFWKIVSIWIINVATISLWSLFLAELLRHRRETIIDEKNGDLQVR